jgi:hypothetical protein
MRTIRTLFSLLFLLSCAGVALAQTFGDKTATPGSAAPNFLVPHDSRLETPPVGVVKQPIKPAVQLGLLSKAHATVAPAQNRPVCYAMRSYNFASGDPLSDITRPKSISTCAAAADTHLKGAVVVVQR